MGVRYPELLSFIASYNESRFAAIEATINSIRRSLKWQQHGRITETERTLKGSKGDDQISTLHWKCTDSETVDGVVHIG
jgi:hypothetical protein